ncbi:indolethylamine N-methyltransferase-like [Bombina bombina]|uniref:indolethylamine N-methyltransferase-like n=1 Tax=Bombina bombina TaxID=8345 RepID=UPI00235AFC6E|nr:indolethylamine N-methyltransferase-like [Bombina bombina]
MESSSDPSSLITRIESSSDSSSLKHYLMEEFNPRLLSDTYFSHNSHDELFEESALLPLRLLNNVMSTGRIKGETMIYMQIGTIISPLIPISEFFNDITVLEYNDVCIKELEKWKNTHDDAYDWSHTFQFMAELEGKGLSIFPITSEEWKTRQEKIKTSIKRILKCDFTKENLTDPVTLLKVDCIFLGCLLESVCKDQDDYFRSLKKISMWLKPGGHLILLVVLNASFYTIGEHRFHLVNLDEEFIRKALRDIGYMIETIEMVERKSNHEAISYDHLALITAVMQ